jgi:hypothetical protein
VYATSGADYHDEKHKYSASGADSAEIQSIGLFEDRVHELVSSLEPVFIGIDPSY